MGPAPFSEPETQAIKKYVDEHDNINVLLSFHTFSQLILYPWGHTHQNISVAKDYQTYKAMAEKMAEWNGYTPQQSSDLYIASGDTTDWSYGTHKVFSFTFELDPANSGFNPGGFYPGDEVIQEVFRKNLNPAIYLIQMADNPYRATETGINSNLGF
jgi:carboxypeptidase T